MDHDDPLRTLRLATLLDEYRAGRNPRLDLGRDAAPFLASLGVPLSENQVTDLAVERRILAGRNTVTTRDLVTAAQDRMDALLKRPSARKAEAAAQARAAKAARRRSIAAA